MADHSMLHEWIEAVRVEQDPEWCGWALQGIDRAVVFHLEDLESIPWTKPGQWPVLKPPYPLTVLECMYGNERVRKRCITLCVESAGVDGFYVIPAEKEFGGCWSTGIPVRGWRDAGGCLHFEDMDGKQPPYENLVRWEVAASVFNVLQCVNVRTLDNPAPEKLNAKRVARGKLPLYSFKTLHLHVPNERRQSAHLGGTHASPRLHLRRGHIRRLGEGRSIWVQSCIVGSGPGVVEKDYRLVAKAAAV